MNILKQAGQIAPNLFMLDTMQFNLSHITTAFCYHDGQQALLMDVGTSDNVSEIIRSLKRFNIPLEHVKGIALTHYHFDHAGGVSRLYKKLIKKNPDFKIYTTSFTQNKLQDPDSHVEAAITTFGEFVGKMQPIPDAQVEQAYHLLDHADNMRIPVDFATGAKIRLIPTPGHSPDHVSPAIYGQSSHHPDFMFAGEAAGTCYHDTELISAATSMPPNYQHEVYLESLSRLIAAEAESIGFCHYGAISGKEAVHRFLTAHQSYVKELYAAIQRRVAENPEVRYVIKKLEEDHLHVKYRVGDRFTKDPVSQRFLSGLQLALTYGMLIEMGLRKSKYEPRDV